MLYVYTIKICADNIMVKLREDIFADSSSSISSWIVLPIDANPTHNCVACAFNQSKHHFFDHLGVIHFIYPKKFVIFLCFICSTLFYTRFLSSFSFIADSMLSAPSYFIQLELVGEVMILLVLHHLS